MWLNLCAVYTFPSYFIVLLYYFKQVYTCVKYFSDSNDIPENYEKFPLESNIFSHRKIVLYHIGSAYSCQNYGNNAFIKTKKQLLYLMLHCMIVISD